MTATPDRAPSLFPCPGEGAHTTPGRAAEGSARSGTSPVTAAARGAPEAGTRGPSAPTPTAPVPSLQAEGPWDLTVTVYGTPGPQGSKRSVPHSKTGRVVTMESSKNVKPWREAVKAAALDAMHGVPLRLDGPLAAEFIFTVADQPAGKPSWWPRGEPWRRTLRVRPATKPDLSKLVRSTEDALTDAGAIWDDARIVQIYTAAHYVLGPDTMTGHEIGILAAPGAFIRVRRLPLPVGVRP